MPVFRYNGYRESGSNVSGTLDAEGRLTAIEKLKQEGILPVNVEPATSQKLHRRRWGSKKKSERLPLITRTLSTLVSAGVPLVDALSGLAEEEQELWGPTLIDIKEQVRSGTSLSVALEAYPEIFPEFYAGMVAAGEASGTLGRILSELADFLESSSTLRGRVRTAMIYPVFMMVVSGGILAFLMSFVVPKISRIFENTGNTLPILTRWLLAISQFMQQYWWAALFLIGISVWGFSRSYQAKKEVFDAYFLRLPVLGRLIMQLNIARFARTLGLLLQGGIPIIRAISYASKSMGNAHLRVKTDALAGRVVEGVSLASAMKDSEIFPKSLLTLVATGERTGSLDTILLKAANAFETDFDRGVSGAVALFEPALIVGMGLAIGLIVVSILLPIFRMNELVQ